MQYEHIQDGLYRESAKMSVTETRKQWNQHLLTYLNLIDWDLMRPGHQKRFIESVATSEPMLARGLDKIGRMVLVIHSTHGTMVAVQNGQYMTSIFTSKELADSMKSPLQPIPA